MCGGVVAGWRDGVARDEVWLSASGSRHRLVTSQVGA